MQSRSQSFVETVVRASFNYGTALTIQLTVFPAIFHVHPPLATNIGIGLLFMANSIIGGYAVRRFFNFLPTLRRNSWRSLRTIQGRF